MKNGIDKIIRSLYRLINFKLIDMRIKRRAKRSPLKIVVGAAGLFQSGWVPTDIEHLNILYLENWERYFKDSSIDAILAEHVWEHLTVEEARLAAKNCFQYLKPHGYIRVAVPDGFHPSPEYVKAISPGGSGAGANNHKVLYNYKTLSKVFKSVGFDIALIEWFDEDGHFHSKKWDKDSGLIRRSSKYDERNKNGQFNYTSIILDAWKR